MVAFHDVWAKGVQMASVGFQKKMLEGATICTQLATSESKRQAQNRCESPTGCRFQRASGPSEWPRRPLGDASFFLSIVIRNRTRMSRGRVFKLHAGFLSLAGSHSVAFLRCLQNGIQGPDGFHCSIAKSDPAWKAIEEGWTWVVLAASIEEANPPATELYPNGRQQHQLHFQSHQ